MTIAASRAMPATARVLEGQVATVTGSTSGIGPSIPREKVICGVLLTQQPNKRFATVEEIGAIAVFQASGAGASITEAALPVDGGWPAQ